MDSLVKVIKPRTQGLILSLVTSLKRESVRNICEREAHYSETKAGAHALIKVTVESSVRLALIKVPVATSARPCSFSTISFVKMVFAVTISLGDADLHCTPTPPIRYCLPRGKTASGSVLHSRCQNNPKYAHSTFFKLIEKRACTTRIAM